MSIFKNVKKLNKQLEYIVSDVLKDEVADATIETMQDAIVEVVYESYLPKDYRRRGIRGGLISDDNIIGEVVGTTLTVENVAPFSQSPPSQNTGEGLAGLTEYGEGWNGHHYDFPVNGKAYMKPRPFIQHTRDTLSNSDILENAMEKGLKKRGLTMM